MRLRIVLVLGGSALLLANCVTDRDRPGGMDIGGRHRTAETAQSLATPAMIKDCSDKVAAAFPDVKPTGPYSFSPNAAVALNEIDARLLMGDQFAVLAAPTTHKAALGLEVKSVAGCSYLLESGKLVFRKVHPPTSFMQTTAVRI